MPVSHVVLGVQICLVYLYTNKKKQKQIFLRIRWSCNVIVAPPVQTTADSLSSIVDLALSC